MALEAIRERVTLNELAAKYGVSPVMISSEKGRQFTCHSFRQARIFPLDALRFFLTFLFVGIRSVLNGE